MTDTAGERTISLVHASLPDGVGIFSIRDPRQTVFYAFREIPCDVGGRGFAVHKLGLGTLYHVRVGRREECSCECMGFLAHGVCRHVLGLRALTRQGLI
jgi:hypothetical protein